MKQTTTLMFCILIFASTASALRINELQYNPEGDDYDFEFIELYAENETNVSGYYFDGIDFTFPENTTISGYLVLANTLNDSGENNDFLDKYKTECIFEYGGALSNEGETISLFSKTGNVIDTINYTNIAEIDYSLERTINGFVVSDEKGGTPGRENTRSFFYNESENKNETQNNETNSCDASIKISLSKTTFQNKEQISIKHMLANITDSYTIEYWIDDFFNKTIRTKQNTTNTNTKHYTPSINEKEKIMILKAKLYVECNDTNLSNNFYEEMIFVFNPNYIEEEKTEESEDKKDETKTKAKEKPEITSFYTLTKNLVENKTISIYAFIKNPSQSGEFSAVLIQNNETIDKEDFVVENKTSKKLTFDIALKENANNFSLKLYKDTILYDSSSLHLAAVPINHTPQKQARAEEKFINNSKELELNINENNDKKEVSSNSFKIAAYLLLGLSVALNTVLIWRR